MRIRGAPEVSCHSAGFARRRHRSHHFPPQQRGRKLAVPRLSPGVTACPQVHSERGSKGLKRARKPHTGFQSSCTHVRTFRFIPLNLLTDFPSTIHSHRIWGMCSSLPHPRPPASTTAAPPRDTLQSYVRYCSGTCFGTCKPPVLGPGPAPLRSRRQALHRRYLRQALRRRRALRRHR